MSVDYTFEQLDPTVATRITLPGGCQMITPTTSTTTTIAPTTTVPAPAAPAAAVAARPTYTG